MSKTPIEWTEQTWNPVLLAVNFLVAVSAQCQAVRNFKTQFWKFRKLFDVMRVKIAAFDVTAMLTSKIVSLENKLAPVSIFDAFSYFFVQRCNTAFPILISLPASSAPRLTQFCRYFLFGFKSVSFIKSIFIIQSSLTHKFARFKRMSSSFKVPGSAFCVLFAFNSFAKNTLRRQSVKAAVINVEIVTFLPRTTFETPFQMSAQIFKIFINTYSNFIRCCFNCALFSLCHKQPLIRPLYNSINLIRRAT